MAEEVSRLVEAIQNGIESRLVDVHTALPGVVKSYNASDQLIDVTPALKRKYKDGSVVNLPVITNVPVCFPRGGKAHLTFPLEQGDYVLLVFSERSIDFWIDQGNITDPKEPRKFNLSDAIAIPGVYPKPASNPRASDQYLRLEYDKASIELDPSGKFKIQNIDGDELFDLLVQTLDALIQAQTATLLGNQPLLNNATFVQLKAKMEALKGS